MSTTELIPLFPSATHPAIPIAFQILSTLRHLTAPGKGNDLKPEERAALVGISALLGCERVQSKDLIEKSAQQASSVSPAHFRSALLHARRVLSTATASNSTSPNSKRSSRALSSTTHQSPPKPATTTVSPFQTPKKRFKYSSGMDLSGLVRSPHGHEPVVGSPLKLSVTPSRVRDRLLRVAGKGGDTDQAAMNAGDGEDGGSGDEEEEEGGGTEVNTPTKKVKYAARPGVDLETAVGEPSVPLSGKRKRVDTSAFFALRPGSGSSSTSVITGRQRSPIMEDGLPEVRTRSRREEGRVRKEKKLAPRRDWTYAESEWDGRDVSEANEQVLQQIWGELPAWLEAHDLPPVSETAARGLTVLDILLSTNFSGKGLDPEVHVEA